MIEFLYHKNFEKEIARQEKRFRHLREGLAIFERLCKIQFNPAEPKQVVAPAKLHRLTQNDLWSIWKIELAVPKSGLRPNQCPRVWFVVKGEIIVFLCLSSHIDNYSDKEIGTLALSRVSDFF